MLNELLSEYSIVKNLKIAKNFSEPQELKLKELKIVLDKITPSNFKEFNNLNYKNILLNRLYTIPETGVNFILKVPKILEVRKKMLEKEKDATLELGKFIPNENTQPNGDTVNFFRNYFEKLYISTLDKNGTFYKFLLLIDEIKEETAGRSFVFLDKRYGEPLVEKFIKDYCNNEFAAFYRLGFNILIENKDI